MTDNIIQDLKEKGHSTEVLDDFTDVRGRTGVIKIVLKSDAEFGGGDPRGDGVAIGY